MAAYLPKLQNLSLSCCSGILSQGFRQIVKDCPELTTIDLTYTGIKAQDFPELVTGNTLIGILDKDAIERIRCSTHTIAKVPYSKR